LATTPRTTKGVTMTKTEIINGLRQLSVDMVEIGTAIDYYYGLNPLSQHGKEMVGVGKIAEELANEMEKENDRQNNHKQERD